MYKYNGSPNNGGAPDHMYLTLLTVVKESCRNLNLRLVRSEKIRMVT